MCALGPEFLLFLAIAQWESASRSLHEFHRLGHTEWSMKHAFFADMGGFVLSTGDGVTFPLTAKQLHYLLVEGYIKEAVFEQKVMLSKRVIDDKNKTDSLVRALTILQILWFVVNCIARVAQALTVTTLELTTLGFIVTTVAVSFFWAHKPSDIGTASHLTIDATVAEIHFNAGDVASQEWFRTPLDFVNDRESYFTLYWTYSVNMIQKVHLLPVRTRRPITSIPDDNMPSLFDTSVRAQIIGSLFSLFCFAINISGWNFWFPSTLERHLWRISSIVLLVTMYVGVSTQIYLVYIHESLKKGFQVLKSGDTVVDSRTAPHAGRTATKNLLDKCRNLAARLRNLTPNKDPAFAAELKVLIVFFPGLTLYVLARAYLMIEDVISLRSLPANAYETVNWAQFLPHA